MTSLPSQIKISNRIVLRQLTPTDVQRLFFLVDANRQWLGQWFPWVATTVSPADSERFINDMITKRREGSVYGYGMFVDGVLEGHIGLHVTERERPEIGYWIAESASGRGVTTEAVVALTKLGFEMLALPFIIIRAEARNAPSNRVAEKTGYTFKGLEYNEVVGREANTWIKQN